MEFRRQERCDDSSEHSGKIFWERYFIVVAVLVSLLAIEASLTQLVREIV
jgi:hypothetical protein